MIYRYDYEEVDLDAANKVMERLQTKFKEFEVIFLLLSEEDSMFKLGSSTRKSCR